MVPVEPAAGMMNVEVVYCPGPGQVDLSPLELPVGTTLAEALHASGVLLRHGLLLDGLRAGIWFKSRELDTPLRHRDRVEVYRPLTVDPKEARRQRYRRARQGNPG